MEVSIRSTFIILRKILHRTAAILSVLLIIISSAVVIPYIFGIKPYVVTTGSMVPAIPVYSICFVNEKMPYEQVQIGDIITFRTNEDIRITHRVTAISDGAYITKGDANNVEDPPVTSEEYIGKTVLVLPKTGIIIMYLHTRAGKLAAVSLIIFLLVLAFLPDKRNSQTQTVNNNKTHQV